MILITGAAGSGKSAQAKLIEDEANVKWLSTGVLLREKATKEQKVRMEQGELLDDGEVEDILHNAISEVSNGTRILIDGFPRRDSQIQWFRGYIKAARRDLEAIVHIIVPEDLVVNRLIERGRPDDREDIVRARYKLYENEILPMLDEMEARGTRIINVDGNRNVDEIHQDIMSALKGII